LAHPMPILILSRTRPSLRWERISVSHSIATAASPTAAKEPDKYRYLIGAMSGPSAKYQLAPPTSG
jgi:dihydrofolate reductase